jgi:carbon storage regulator
MLVLTRRLNEKVVFPGFQASVQVLSIHGNAVRLGIQAPRAVTVLREEIPDRQAEWGAPAQVPAPDARADPCRLTRLVGTRLKVAGLGLELLRGQLQAGEVEDALAIVGGLAEELHLLQRRLVSEAQPTPQPPRPARDAREALLVEDDAEEGGRPAPSLRLDVFEQGTGV